MIHQQFRPDIDGLRALAVLSVIGFHAFPGWINGGFTGVDIFFVISGYVIGNSIILNLNNKSFSLYEFYVRRIKRIFPSLIVILTASIIVWWALLSPIDHGIKNLGKHIAAGAWFVSNFVFWGESGYFDLSAEQKPLLHLWSLAIEEQFYIVWPLILLLCWKYRNLSLPIILTLAMLSCARNIFVTSIDPVSAFYSPISRFWELIAGTFVAYILFNKLPSRPNHYKNMAGIIGTVLIVAGIIFTHKNNAFPGWWAFLPVAGCTLIIWSGPNSIINKSILSNPILAWIGLISYPLYLWHWPALALYNHISVEYELGHQWSRVAKIASIAISVVLAWLTFLLIESPIRKSHDKKLPYALFACMTFVGIIGLGLYNLDTNRLRFTPWQHNEISKLERVTKLQDLEITYGNKPCFIFDRKQSHELFEKNNCFKIKYPNNPVVFLYGDSHSASLSLGLRPYFEDKNINFVQVSSGWCEPTSNNPDNTFCEKINQLAMAKIKELSPDVVIINAHWLAASTPPYFIGKSSFYDHLLSKINRVKEAGAKNIVVVGQIPTWNHSLPEQLYRNFIRYNTPIPKKTNIGINTNSLLIETEMHDFFLKNNINYASIRDFLCDQNGCLTATGSNIEIDITVWDYGHLTPQSAKFIANHHIGPPITRLLTKPSINMHDTSRQP